MRKTIQVLEVITPTIEPIPPSPRSTGCGEGVSYEGHDYYYRVGKRIPKNKISVLKWEGDWGGRVHGEKMYLIIAHDGQDYIVLQHCHYEVKKYLEKYKNSTPQQAIQKIKDEQIRQENWLKQFPKCECGNRIILIGEKQPKNKCYSCWERST